MELDVWEAELTLLEEIQIGIWSRDVGEHVIVPLGRPATVDDLRLTKFKAEIVNGHLVVIGPTTPGPADAAANIRKSLYDYEESVGGGYANGFRVAFIVDLPNRRAFCPDVSWYTGKPDGTAYPVGAPIFVAEIRDPLEYGDEAELRITAKRADYFAAGTQVVWDVDVLRENLIRAYRADDPEDATVFRRGEIADAEPAVPGWRFAVDDLFRSGKQER